MESNAILIINELNVELKRLNINKHVIEIKNKKYEYKLQIS